MIRALAPTHYHHHHQQRNTHTNHPCRFLLANCCISLGKPAEAERVLLEGTDVLHKGPKDCRDEILAEPCPIPFGAAGLRLLGEASQSFLCAPGTFGSRHLQQRRPAVYMCSTCVSSLLLGVYCRYFTFARTHWLDSIAGTVCIYVETNSWTNIVHWWRMGEGAEFIRVFYLCVEVGISRPETTGPGKVLLLRFVLP